MVYFLVPKMTSLFLLRKRKTKISRWPFQLSGLDITTGQELQVYFGILSHRGIFNKTDKEWPSSNPSYTQYMV